MDKLNKESYKSIFKSTALFGFIQFATILVTIVKTKVVALLLGANGLGVFGLLTSTVSLIEVMSNLGIERSAVRNVAEFQSPESDKNGLDTLINVIRRLVWLSGLIGMILFIIFSGSISEYAFGNDEYRVPFIILSITILINQLAVGHSVLLRGLRRLRDVAKSTLAGAVSSLAISIPLYYFWENEGIVPAIILSSISVYFFKKYFAAKISIIKSKVPITVLLDQSKDILKLGIVLSVTSFFTHAALFITRSYISVNGSIEDVGFYHAGFAILNGYFSLFFTAISTDYYPKLASIIKDESKSHQLINEQSEMILLMITPLLMVFILIVNVFIIILYTAEFYVIKEMLIIGALGVFFKATSWSLGVIFMSKGDIKPLITSELSANLILLVTSIVLYTKLGLIGLGVGFLIGNIFHYVQTYLILKFRYGFKYNMGFAKIFLCSLVSIVVLVFGALTLTSYVKYILALLVISIIVFYLNELNTRTDMLKSLVNKFKK